MTDAEVLEEAAVILGQQWPVHAERLRALKSKPPEKSPEVECSQCAEVWAFFQDFDRTREENWQRKMAAPICAYGCDRPTYGELAMAGGWDGEDRGQAFEDAIRSGWLEHVRVCPNHPQRRVEAERDELRFLHKAAADAVAELAGRLEKSEARVTMTVEAWKDVYGKVQAERDALKAQLEATDRRAKESMARVEALTAEVRDHEWRARGSPMSGEPTTPGTSPFDGHPFVPMPERPTICATCGYSDEFASVPGLHATGTPQEPGSCCGDQGSGVRGGR